MPTQDQIAGVVAEIERIQAERAGVKAWAELTHSEKYVALSEIEWAGFTRREEIVVIGRILADEPPELWMEGMQRPVSHQAGSTADRARDQSWRETVAAPVVRGPGRSQSTAEERARSLENGSVDPEREALVRETYRLTREIGYVGFREEFFDDPQVIDKWPDPKIRERELRNFWNDQPEGTFGSFVDSHANESTETLIAYRDYLRRVAASGVEAQIMFCERVSELGRRERMHEGEDSKLSPGYENAEGLTGDFRPPLSPAESKLLAEEIRQDEHAARVRDYGEADAATYEERVRAGADSVRHLPPAPPPVDPDELERLVTDLVRGWVAQRDRAGDASVDRGGLELADEKVVQLPRPFAAKTYLPSPGEVADQRYEPSVGGPERGPTGRRGR
jgi:hypothetical protein